MMSSTPIPLPESAAWRYFAPVRGLLHRRTTWVLLDQAIVSGGNFLTANQLARFLPQSEFGIFSVLLETMLYVNSLQAALVIYPLTIRGATSQGRNLGKLATASLVFTLAMLPLMGLATAFAANVLAGPGFALAAMLALVLWQLQETTRRALMADLRFAAAVPGDLISFLGQAIFVFVAWRLGRLSLNVALLGMAVTSMLGTVIQALQIGLTRITWQDLRILRHEFWVDGRWLLLTNVGGVVSSTAYWWVLGWTHGEEQCAVFAVIQLVLKLSNPVITSLGNLIVPAVAQIAALHGLHGAQKTAMRYILLGCGLLIPYFLALVLLPELALRIFYGWETPYAVHGPLLRLFVINHALSFASIMTGAWLVGLGHSRLSFWTQVVNMIVSVLIGLPMTYYFGVKGLILGGMVACVAITVTDLYFLWRVTVTNDLPIARQQQS